MRTHKRSAWDNVSDVTAAYVAQQFEEKLAAEIQNNDFLLREESFTGV